MMWCQGQRGKCTLQCLRYQGGRLHGWNACLACLGRLTDLSKIPAVYNFLLHWVLTLLVMWGCARTLGMQKPAGGPRRTALCSAHAPPHAEAQQTLELCASLVMDGVAALGIHHQLARFPAGKCGFCRMCARRQVKTNNIGLIMGGHLIHASAAEPGNLLKGNDCALRSS